MSRRRHWGRSAGLAVLFSLVLVTDSLAVTWSAAVKVTPTQNANMLRGGLAGSGSTLHLVYRRVEGTTGRVVIYRRSTNDGVTWSAERKISRAGVAVSVYPVLAVGGSTVDAMWAEGDVLVGPSRLYYRRSTDGGTNWGNPALVSSTTTSVVGFPVIARNASTVIFSYTDRKTGEVFVRRSTDGGVTWKNRLKVGMSTRHLPDTTGTLVDGSPGIAFGTGVIYLVWMSTNSTASMRRSLDGGATWTAATSLSTAAVTGTKAYVAATGSAAIVTFTTKGSQAIGYAAARLSSDKGVHWSAAAKASIAGWFAESMDVIRAGGKWRHIYIQCVISTCNTGHGIWYRDSTNGTTWSAATRVSSTAQPYMAWPSLAYTTTDSRVYVAWSASATKAPPNFFIYVRGGS